jgi:transcriptional regulator with XRE-family HTH domain
MGLDLRAVTGPNVRAERVRRGLRQEDLAARLDMARATLADLERGERRLYFDEALVVCDALGLRLVDLVAGQQPEAREARSMIARIFRRAADDEAERMFAERYDDGPESDRQR